MTPEFCQQTRYEMHEGEFRLPEPFTTSADPYQLRHRVRYKIADLYVVGVDVEICAFVAIKPGVRVSLTFQAMNS